MYTPFSPNTIISSFTNLMFFPKIRQQHTVVSLTTKSGRYVFCFPPSLFSTHQKPILLGHPRIFPPKVSKAAEWNPLP